MLAAYMRNHSVQRIRHQAWIEDFFAAVRATKAGEINGIDTARLPVVFKQRLDLSG